MFVCLACLGTPEGTRSLKRTTEQAKQNEQQANRVLCVLTWHICRYSLSQENNRKYRCVLVGFLARRRRTRGGGRRGDTWRRWPVHTRGTRLDRYRAASTMAQRGTPACRDPAPLPHSRYRRACLTSFDATQQSSRRATLADRRGKSHLHQLCPKAFFVTPVSAIKIRSFLLGAVGGMFNTVMAWHGMACHALGTASS